MIGHIFYAKFISTALKHGAIHTISVEKIFNFKRLNTKIAIGKVIVDAKDDAYRYQVNEEIQK